MPDEDQGRDDGEQPDIELVASGDTDLVPDEVGDDQQQERRQLAGLFRASSFEGPVPHPDHARVYEELMPGFMDREVTMREKEQIRRHSNDVRVFEHAALQERETTRRLIIHRGSISFMLLVLGLFGLLLGIYADAPEIGGGIVIAEVVGVGVNALWSSIQRSRRGDDEDDS